MLTNELTVRMVDKEENLIGAYTTSKFEETIKFYKFAKDNGIEINVHTEKNGDQLAWVDNIDINFGNDDNLFSLTLYCEVQ